MDESSQDKTEPASGKKKEDSRRKGKVARSQDLNSAFMIIFGLLILNYGGAAIAAKIAALASSVFANAGATELNQTTAHHVLVNGLGALAMIIMPVVVGLLLAGLAVSYAQVGFKFSMEPLELKWGKLNPMNGIQNLFFSRRSIVEIAKNLVKVGLVAIVAYVSLKNIVNDSLSLADSDIEAVLGFMVGATFNIGLKVGLAFVALALLDYVFQKYEYERDLKMTKQEVKEEGKMLEGDPLIKGRIKQIQKQIAYRRMMQDVPKADVVLTNPTHVAVALKYEPARMAAPKVVAKGAELIAKRIKELALQNNVPVVEDRVLARAIYKAVDIGETIPEKLFQAVAQILAYIYRVRNVAPALNAN
jgi:flagellar biosynthetic protein FlhB